MIDTVKKVNVIMGGWIQYQKSAVVDHRKCRERQGCRGRARPQQEGEREAQCHFKINTCDF